MREVQPRRGPSGRKARHPNGSFSPLLLFDLDCELRPFRIL
jgi:hypothetical protein